MGAKSDKCVLPRSPGPRPSASGSRTHPRIGRPAMRPDAAGGRCTPARAVSIPPYATTRCAACSTARRDRPVRICAAARSCVSGDTTAALTPTRRTGDATGSCSPAAPPAAGTSCGIGPVGHTLRLLRPTAPCATAPIGCPRALRCACHRTSCSAGIPPRSTCAYVCSKRRAVGRPRRLRKYPGSASHAARHFSTKRVCAATPFSATTAARAASAASVLDVCFRAALRCRNTPRRESGSNHTPGRYTRFALSNALQPLHLEHPAQHGS